MHMIEAIVLGVAQGLTEFLPVSSSGHLVLIPWFFKWEDPGLAFDVFLHLGTLFAIGLYFFGDLRDIAVQGLMSIVERRIGYERNRVLFWLLVVGTIPAVVAGLLFHKHAEEAFRSPLLIAGTLAFVGFLIYYVDGRFPSLRRQEEMSFKEAFFIGLAQACALVPGVSRSGATMGMARRLGFNRETAARFSFLMCFPIILGAGVMESRHLINAVAEGNMQWSYMIAGFLASLLSGLAAIHFLLGYLRNADLAVFFWYRLGLSIFVLIWSIVYKV